MLVSGLITIVIHPGDLPAAPLLLVYTITWLLEMGGLALFWGVRGPALVFPSQQVGAGGCTENLQQK